MYYSCILDIINISLINVFYNLFQKFYYYSDAKIPYLIKYNPHYCIFHNFIFFAKLWITQYIYKNIYYNVFALLVYLGTINIIIANQ